MEGKKRYIAIILFLLICLTVFTFATTGDEELEKGNGNGNNVQEVTGNGSNESEDKDNTDSKKEESNANESNGSTNNSNSSTDEDEDLDGTGNVDNSAYDKALEAVEELEELLTDEQAEIARDLVDEITNSDQYKELIERIEDAEDAIDATELVEKLEQMVKDAAEKADITDAKDYRDDEVTDAVNEIDGENLAEVKEDLLDRIEELSKILDDETDPTVEGIEDGKHTKEDVSLTITDENEVTTTVTKDGNAYNYVDTFTEEGTYEVTVVDAAFNETTLTFTIDKTAPKFEGLPSREAHIDKYAVDVTDENDTTITLQKDHGKFKEIQEGYEITEEGTYQLVAVDKAGNKYTTWVIIDKTYPTISGVTNGSIVNKCENVYVFDRYLKTVVVDGKTYTRKDFTHDVKNENFNFSPEKICAEGTHTVTATDMSGKTRTETFTIDKTKAVRLSADFYVDGKNSIQEIIDGETYNVYYAKEGRVVRANIAMNEELKGMPTFTFYVGGKSYSATETSTSYDATNKKWYYHATVVITDKMADGELTFVASDIYDKAGNKTDDVAGPSNSRRIFVDQTEAKIMSSDFYVHGLTAKDKVFYTKKGKKITVNITTNEILGSNPTFVLHNNGKDYNVDKVVYRGLNDKGYYLYQADYQLTEDSEMTDGEVTFTVSNIIDRADNTTDPVTAPTNSRRVVIDATPNRVTQTSLSTKVSEGKTYYVINGETIDFSIGFREMLSEDAKVTIGGKEVTLTYDKYYKAINTHLYKGTLTIPADETEMVEGELQIVITNITDEVGNKGFYYQTNGTKVIETHKSVLTTNGKKVIYDRTHNRVTQTSLSTKVSEGKTYYVINGETIDFSIGFRELLGEDAKVTIGGKEVTLTYDKYYEAINTHLYRGTLTIPEDESEMVEGELEIVITNITDKAGNKGFYYQTNGTKVIESYKNTITTNGKKVIYDRTPNRVTQTSLSTSVADGKTYYVINGGTIEFSIGFRELLGEDAKVTIGGKEVTLTYDKYYTAINTHLYKGTLTIAEDETELAEGELEIAISNITDKAGNKGFYYQTNGIKVIDSYKNTITTNGKKVIYDRTNNRVTQTSLSTSVADGKTYYVKNGGTIEFSIGFRELLGEDAVVTIGGKEVVLTYDKYYTAINTHLYKGTLTIAEDESEMAEGELEIVITNITDKAGNKGFYYQTNGTKIIESYKNTITTNGKKVIYDRTPNRVTQTFFRGENEINKVYYATNGSKIQFNIGFSELLSEDAVVTIGGKKVELTYEKYVKATNSHMYYGYLEINAEDQLPEGTLEIKISNITDFVGNKGFYYQTNGTKVYNEVTQATTTNGKSIFYDISAPEVTPSYTETTVIEDSVDEFTAFPTFEIIDNSNAEVKTELVTNTVNTHKVGTYKLVYKFTDVVGNSTEKTITVKVVDKTAPTISGITDGAYYNTKDTHAIPSVYDKNGAILMVKTTIGDVELKSIIKNEKEMKQVGTYTVYAVDTYGNKSEEITVHIDPYAPKVLVLDRIENVSGAYLPIKPVILEHNLDTIEVELDGKKIDYKQGDQLTKDGKYKMTVTDKAGNSTTVEFTMDSVAPTMLVSPTTLGVVDSLDLNDADNITGLILSEDAEFQLLKAGKNITVLDKNIPIYEYTKLPEDGIIDEEGDYILIAYDKAYNVTAVKFVVDRTAPAINAEDGKFYSSLTLDVKDKNLSTITVKKQGSLLPTVVENGYVIERDGTYEITAKDIVGVNPLFGKDVQDDHTTTITIHIDTKAPTSNVVEGGIYKKVTVSVDDTNLDEESITINGSKYNGGEITEEGNYVLVAKDLAGNTLTVNFEIDKTPITISGATQNGLYNTDVELEVTARDEEPVIKLNGSEIGKKFTINADGEYKVKVTDKWGNEEEVTFTIDKTPSTINNPFAAIENEIGARKDSSVEVKALVTDNIDADKYINPVVTHSVKGDMGELNSIPTTKDYVGRYTLTYNTTDKAGNAAEELVVYVDVIINDYVVSFVDVDGKNFTYTYGDTIPAFEVKIYSDALEEYVTFDASDITFEVADGKTIKNVGTYTVKASANTAKFPNAAAAEQVVTIVKKDVEVTLDKNYDKLSSIDKYEFNGVTDPFKVVSIDGIIAGDEVNAEITYAGCTFDVGDCVATVKLDNNNYNLTNPTHEFTITRATAEVTLPTTADGEVVVENGEGFIINDFVNIEKYNNKEPIEGNIKVTLFGREILNKKYEIGYTIIDVTAKNTKNVEIKNPDLEVIGLEEISNIVTSIKNDPFVSKLAKIEENLTDNTKSALAKEKTYGTSRGYVNIEEVK